MLVFEPIIYVNYTQVEFAGVFPRAYMFSYNHSHISVVHEITLPMRSSFLAPSPGQAGCLLHLSEGHWSASVLHQPAAVLRPSSALPVLQLLAEPVDR